MNYNWQSMLGKDMIVDKQIVGSSWHHFNPTTSQLQLEMTQSSIVVKDFDENKLLFPMQNYEEGDIPMGEMSVYVLMMMIRKLEKTSNENNKVNHLVV